MTFWRDPSPQTVVTFRGNRVPVNLAFDNVLTMFEVFEYDRFNEWQKLDTIFELFVDESLHSQFPLEIRIEFVFKLLKDKLDIDLAKQQEEDETVPLFDWVEDAARIHSSFLFDYSMDLREQQGKMDWETFMGLLSNLSDETQFGQALYYRQCPIPKLEKGGHNADEIKRVKAQKDRYALKEGRVADKLRQMREKELLARMEAHTRKVKGG